MGTINWTRHVASSSPMACLVMAVIDEAVQDARTGFVDTDAEDPQVFLSDLLHNPSFERSAYGKMTNLLIERSAYGKNGA